MNHKKDVKNKNMLVIDLGNQVESVLDTYENIASIVVYKEVNLRIIHPKEEEEITKLSHIKIRVNKIKVGALFNFIS